MENTSLSKALRTPHLGNKIIYILYTCLGSLLLFTTLYTFLKTTSNLLTMEINSVVLMASGVLVLYIVLQAILSYGFFFMQKWIIPALGAHLLIVYASALLLFPTLGLEEYAMQTIKGASIFLVPLLFALATKKVLSGKYLQTVPVTAYTLIVVTLLVIHMLLATGTF
jgi:hypothetical protein